MLVASLPLQAQPASARVRVLIQGYLEEEPAARASLTSGALEDPDRRSQSLRQWRERGQRATQPIRELLQSFRAPRNQDPDTPKARGSLQAGGQALSPGDPLKEDAEANFDPTIWAAGIELAEVSLDQLETLRRHPAVQRVIPDRRVPAFSRVAQARPRPSPSRVARLRKLFYGSILSQGIRLRRTQGVTGKGVRIGVIDSGVDPSHPSLRGKLLAFRDFSPGARREAYDPDGHGTHCAGVLVGKGFGMAPDARLLVARTDGFSHGTLLSSLLKAMQWMLDPDQDPRTQDQPHIVSNSWGLTLEEMGEDAEIFRPLVRAWRRAGILPVFAAGNGGPRQIYVPAAYPEALAVGAVDSQLRVAPFSSGGRIRVGDGARILPDLVAPGVEVTSTYPGQGFAALDGTSMACPHVAGGLALLRQAVPRARNPSLLEALRQGARDLGPRGLDLRSGAGMLQLESSFRFLKQARRR